MPESVDEPKESVSPVVSDDFDGRIRLGGLFGMGLASHHDLGSILDYHESEWDEWNEGGFEFTSDDFSGGFIMGVYAEYAVSENFALGVEYVRLSGKVGWRISDSDEYGSLSYSENYKTSGNLASLYGFLRLPIGDSSFAWRLGGGVGYIYGASLELEFVEEDDWIERWSVEASGSAPAIHGFVGAEYQPASHLLLSANATYRVVAVDELTSEGGMILRWSEDYGEFTTEEGEPVSLDFTGLGFSISAAYVF